MKKNKFTGCFLISSSISRW